MKIYVPRDAAARGLGADEVAAAVLAEAAKRGVTVDLVRNGSRGMVWLEPLVEVETDKGPMALRMGGNRLEVGGKPAGGVNSIMGEYPALYARMADLVSRGQSDVDLAPMVHVADALTLGKRIITDAFEF